MQSVIDPSVRYLTDSGLETTLVFTDGRELPSFAAFVLLDQPDGRERLRRYFREHADVAREHGLGLVFEAPTWRANTDWGATVGYDAAALDRVNRNAVQLLRDIESEFAGMPTVVSGQIGPRGDGYRVDAAMTAEEAADYHRPQIAALHEADVVTALTMNYADEAVGIVKAARDLGQNVVISFTTEIDGRLPSGQSLGDAIEEVDDRTGARTAYYMVNCAHPSHFDASLAGEFVDRIVGVRANASPRSHAELDEATELDIGDPHALGRAYAALASRLPALAVFGGCCGTDIRHIREIAAAAAPRTGVAA